MEEIEVDEIQQEIWKSMARYDLLKKAGYLELYNELMAGGLWRFRHPHLGEGPHRQLTGPSSTPISLVTRSISDPDK
jgi:hypothetical protein